MSKVQSIITELEKQRADLCAFFGSRAAQYAATIAEKHDALGAALLENQNQRNIIAKLEGELAEAKNRLAEIEAAQQESKLLSELQGIADAQTEAVE